MKADHAPPTKLGRGKEYASVGPFIRGSYPPPRSHMLESNRVYKNKPGIHRNIIPRYRLSNVRHAYDTRYSYLPPSNVDGIRSRVMITHSSSAGVYLNTVLDPESHIQQRLIPSNIEQCNAYNSSRGALTMAQAFDLYYGSLHGDHPKGGLNEVPDRYDVPRRLGNQPGSILRKYDRAFFSNQMRLIEEQYNKERQYQEVLEYRSARGLVSMTRESKSEDDSRTNQGSSTTQHSTDNLPYTEATHSSPSSPKNQWPSSTNQGFLDVSEDKWTKAFQDFESFTSRKLSDHRLEYWLTEHRKCHAACSLIRSYEIFQSAVCERHSGSPEFRKKLRYINK